MYGENEMNGIVKPIGFGNLLVGSFCLPLVMHDGSTHLRHESRIQSGDYFETIATELENLSELTEDVIVQMKLEDAIEEFEYIQQHYKLIPRSKAKRYKTLSDQL